MLFAILLIVWLRKINAALILWKKYFNTELVMTKEDDWDFENSIKCWICDNDCVNGDVKVKDHCHVTGKYRDL